MLGSLFPQDPEFEGRRVATFHNQRDFIFFRHHRYIFDGSEKVRIQELGPRFTLKLQWLQHGTFDPKNGEFEFKLKVCLFPSFWLWFRRQRRSILTSVFVDSKSWLPPEEGFSCEIVCEGIERWNNNKDDIGSNNSWNFQTTN